jgi:hypothetical protein
MSLKQSTRPPPRGSTAPTPGGAPQFENLCCIPISVYLCLSPCSVFIELTMNALRPTWILWFLSLRPVSDCIRPAFTNFLTRVSEWLHCRLLKWKQHCRCSFRSCKFLRSLQHCRHNCLANIWGGKVTKTILVRSLKYVKCYWRVLIYPIRDYRTSCFSG